MIWILTTLICQTGRKSVGKTAKDWIGLRFVNKVAVMFEDDVDHRSPLLRANSSYLFLSVAAMTHNYCVYDTRVVYPPGTVG